MGNLRVRLTIGSLGHNGSKSVLDIPFYGDFPKFHYEGHNDELLEHLRQVTALDRLSDV